MPLKFIGSYVDFIALHQATKNLSKFFLKRTNKKGGDITSSNITKHRFSMGTSRNPSNTPAILSFPLRIWGVHFRCLVADVAGMMCKKSPFLLLFDFLLVRHLLPSLLSRTDNFNSNLFINYKYYNLLLHMHCFSKLYAIM